MSVINEHWEADADYVDLIVPDDRGGGGLMVGERVAKFYCQEGCPEVARAKLAACAPEMARMLLEHELSAKYDNGNGGLEESWFECRECQAQLTMPCDEKDFVHEESCPWLLLMKKAGLR